MDNQLNPLIKIDAAAGTVRIYVRGSLTLASRPELMHQIKRVRVMGISSPITVDLSRAAFVESFALAGLRFDLTALDAGTGQVAAAGAPGVFLEVMSAHDHAVADSRPDFTALTNPSELSQALEEAGRRPLADYSPDELLAASDAVFGMLDDPAGHSGHKLLARYEAIGEEIARRDPADLAQKHASSS